MPLSNREFIAAVDRLRAAMITDGWHEKLVEIGVTNSMAQMHDGGRLYGEWIIYGRGFDLLELYRRFDLELEKHGTYRSIRAENESFIVSRNEAAKGAKITVTYDVLLKPLSWPEPEAIQPETGDAK